MKQTVPIPPGHRRNLETIKTAAINGDLGPLSACDNQTGERVTLFIAVVHTEEEYNLVPLAQMFGDFNPYRRFQPPVIEVDS